MAHTELFCILDHSTQKSALSLSEVMTIVILFYESYYSQEVTGSLIRPLAKVKKQSDVSID
jgi:hypothetical protein